ncbi:MAG: imidazolonepropionase [Phycisphaerales bacterium]|nr:imidazolonepropionase [Phycisphaerales bacterium]
MMVRHLVNARLLTLAGGEGPRRGEEMQDLGVIENGWLRIEGDRISAVGEGLPSDPAEGTVLDLGGRVVLPAFVDCHTHACWTGSRLEEFEAGLSGVPYLEILKRGGGIMSTVRAVRSASQEELVEALHARLGRMLTFGTTVMEIKSGYGLSTEAELKMLRAIHAVSREQDVTILGTFLGAHAKDPDTPNFVEQTIKETLPAVAEEFPGICCDAYCEDGAWSVEETCRLFTAAQDLGCQLRVHTDQFNSLGMTQAAIEMGARSVDHLEAITPEDIGRLGDSSTIAVLLPASGFSLDQRYAPGRDLVDAGAAVAIATNYNPGSAPSPSMPMTISLACRQAGLLPSEAITAATRNAACVLGVESSHGRLEAGMRADIQILDALDERELAWEFGGPPPPLVLCRGEVVQFLGDAEFEGHEDPEASP